MKNTKKKGEQDKEEDKEGKQNPTSIEQRRVGGIPLYKRESLFSLGTSCGESHITILSKRHE